MTDPAIEVLLNEARYAERLCLRTARLYRRVQTFGVFVSVVSGSAALSLLAAGVPHWVGITGVIALSVFGAALIAMRPGEKVTANEADAKRYAKVRTGAVGMSADQLRVALNSARETDTQEVEPLRAVAFNDVVTEAGRDDLAIPLTAGQRLLAALG